MGKNKRWKRQAKRLIGLSDVDLCDCTRCNLSILEARTGLRCQGACTGDYRRIEKYFKENNIKRGGNLK